MNLREALNKYRREFIRKFPADKAAIMQAATDELEADLANRVLLSKGDTAPDFTLPDARGRSVHLHDRLNEGPVVLTFYRGGWCPYCNLELRAYQSRLAQLREAGAQLIAVSPQSPDASLSTAEKNSLEFDVLSDVGCVVASRYGIVFTLPSALRSLYLELGLDLPAANDTADWQLPVAATFVIDVDGTIALAYIDSDYRNRLEPNDAIAAVRELEKSAA